MDTLTTVIIPLAAMAVAGISAIAAWSAARAAHRSADSAASMAANDAERRHVERTPTVDLSCRPQSERRAMLTVTLTGPVGLEELERVEVIVADPHTDRRPVIAGGPTQQELDAQAWGPYRFVISTAHVISHHTAHLDQVLAGTPVQVAMERAPAPPWAPDPAGWERERAKEPVLVALVCHRAGHPPWPIPPSPVPVR